MTVDLATGAATGFSKISGFENVTGGKGNDTIIGDDGDNVLDGGSGFNSIDGRGGSDHVVVNGSGFIDIKKASGYVQWGPAEGTYTSRVDFTDVEHLTVKGGSGSNIFNDPFSGDVTLLGGPNNDTFIIQDTTGPLSADGGDGSDTYIINAGNLQGPVTVLDTGSSGVDAVTINGTPGADMIDQTGSQVTANGGSVTFGAGIDSLYVDGGGGSDQLVVNGAPPVPFTAGSLPVPYSPPTVGLINAPLDPVQAGIVINANATFTDAGTADTHTAVWNWGDNTSSAGTVVEANGSGSVTGSHSYAAPGVYTVTLTVTDNGGASGQSIYQYVVVYDPSAGFVTGGGWINSPAGAYTANPALEGKANFGFVSRYQNGNTVPTGNTEFQFKVGNLNFKSTSYGWLVVSGAKARFRGVGTFNGAGSYGFELTAWDGQANGGGGVDRFRIKIWNQNQGNGVVYDNMLGAADGADPTTALGGGSIVIHRNGSPLEAAGGAAIRAKVPLLTTAQLQPILAAAIDRWAAAGLDAKQLDRMRTATIAVENLGGSYLGLADAGTNGIVIDDDAAGFGWFIDPTPRSDAEFRRPGNQGEQNRMDLLSAVAHELGHLAGFDHDDGVMGESLATGTRRMPAASVTGRSIDPFAHVFLGGVAVDPFDPVASTMPTRARVRF